ncbi:MAG TPA: hypothetical protein VGR38_05245, partial [Candidatus Polarisedimenticolia bacterium]|nr:hypothetical protein [Candidatus Polarisedimenticolia bacterium]
MASRHRILLRAFLVLAALAIALVLFLILTPWPAELLKRRLAEEITVTTGAEVSIGSLEIKTFPPRVILKNVRLSHGSPEGDALRFFCRKADLTLPYSAYLGRLDRLDSLDLEAPELFFHRSGKKTPGAPEAAAAPLLPVSIGRLLVSDGTLRIQDSLSDWEATLSGMTLRASSNGPKPGSLAGRLEKGIGWIRVGERRVEGVVTSDFKVSGRKVGLTGLEAVSPEAFKAAGFLELDFSEPVAHIRLGARGQLAPAASPRPVLADLSGILEIDAEGEVTDEGVILHGPIRSPQMHVAGQELRSVTGQLDYRSGFLGLRDAHGEALKGAFSGEGTLIWGREGEPGPDLRASLSLEKASAEEVLKLFPLESIRFSGKVSHRGEYHLRGLDLDSLEATGEVSVEGAFEEMPRDRIRGTTGFHLSGKTLELMHARLAGADLETVFDGTVPLASSMQGGGRLSITAGDLSRFERFLHPLPPSVRGPLSGILEESDDATLSFKGSLNWDRGEVFLDGTLVSGPLVLRSTRIGDLEADLRASSRRLDFRKLTLSGGETRLDVQGEWRA